MRDIVTKVDTAPKTGTIKTKTKYKSFEDYARMHRDGSAVEESETCSPTSYMLKSKFKTLGADLDLDKYKGRNECIKDDQESVGSDDSGVGSISEAKELNKYAAYNEFLSGYRKKPEAQQAKKVVRSEIFIHVGDKDRKVSNETKEFVLKPVGTTADHRQASGAQRQWSNESSAEGTSKLNLSKMQNFNSIPRKFEPTAYPKPEVAASIVKPVTPPNLSRSLSLRCDESDGGYEIVLKPKVPPAPAQLKMNFVRSPVKKTFSNQYIESISTPTPAMNNKPPVQQETVNAQTETAFCIPAPPPFMPVSPPAIKTHPLSLKATISASPVRKEPSPEYAPIAANPMQMVFDEIRKRNTNLRQVEEPTTKIVSAVHSIDTEDLCKESSKSIPPPIPPPLMNQLPAEHVGMPPPPPPPPMLCEPNGSLKRMRNVPPAKNAAATKSTQLLEKERQNSSKPAPPPLQQELFKRLSEMNKKNQNQETNKTDETRSEVCAAPAAPRTDVSLPPVPPTQKYNTLSRFLDTEKECLHQQQQQTQYQSSTLDRQDPKKRIVYNVYREMLGSYNAKANGIVAALPSRMVREDQGVKKQLESL